jgi:lactate dehydrogenase-like 2-hydroxyacid dehydrogenase
METSEMPPRPAVLVTRKLSANTEARASRDYDARLDPEDREFTGDELVDRCQHVDAVIACHSEAFSADIVARLPERVRIVANHSVGVDHCDLAALATRGIVVTNSPDVLSDATAEIAMLLLLGAARRASEGDRMVREGRWSFWSPSFMVGTQVTGKRIGIVGMGRVGQVMARRARGFDMQVHYHNRSRLPADGAIVVNTARGALVDESALVEALRSGKLAAAGMDVFVDEPGGNPAFAGLDNVFMLPHVGSATTETRDAMGGRALDNLDAFFAGREPGDRVA